MLWIQIIIKMKTLKDQERISSNNENFKQHLWETYGIKYSDYLEMTDKARENIRNYYKYR